MTDNGAIIDWQTKTMTFSSDHSTTPPLNPDHRAAVRIADDHAILPPRASSMIAVYCEDAGPNVDAIVEGDQRLLFNRGVSVARGIARFKQCPSQVVFTNFTEEYQHLNKGAAIGVLEETQEASQVIAVAKIEGARADASKPPQHINVNLAKPQENRDRLLDLFHRYSYCFSSNSKLLQTPLAKHRITTEDGARPTRQSPYRVD